MKNIITGKETRVYLTKEHPAVQCGIAVWVDDEGKGPCNVALPFGWTMRARPISPKTYPTPSTCSAILRRSNKEPTL